MGKITSLGFGPKPKSPMIGSPAWRAAGRPSKGNMPIKPQPEPADISDLDGLSPEEIVKRAAPEAIQVLVRLMRKPGRHAQAQLGAARELMSYGVSKPATATTLSAPGGGPVESRHEIVFVKPEGK